MLNSAAVLLSLALLASSNPLAYRDEPRGPSLLPESKASEAPSEFHIEGPVFVVGTVRINDEQTGSRIWVSMTESATGADWLEYGNTRAWFFISLKGADHAVRMGQLSLLMESMRKGLHTQIKHQAVSTKYYWNKSGDAYEIDKVRILRKGLRF